MPKPKLKPAEPVAGAEMIGRNIRFMMESRQTEGAELADYLAVSESTFYRRLKKPGSWTINNLERMAKYWDITVSELTGEFRLVAAETDLVLDTAAIDRLISRRANREKL